MRKSYSMMALVGLAVFLLVELFNSHPAKFEAIEPIPIGVRGATEEGVELNERRAREENGARLRATFNEQEVESFEVQILGGDRPIKYVAENGLVVLDLLEGEPIKALVKSEYDGIEILGRVSIAEANDYSVALLAKEARCSGVVTRDGEPAEFETVWMISEAGRNRLVTDAEGRFDFVTAEEGVFRLRVGVLASPSFQTDVMMLRGRHQKQEIDIVPSRIEISVVGPNGEGVGEGFRLRVFPVAGLNGVSGVYERLVATNHLGDATLDGVPAGDYVVEAGYGDITLESVERLEASPMTEIVHHGGGITRSVLALPRLTRISIQADDPSFPGRRVIAPVFVQYLDGGYSFPLHLNLGTTHPSREGQIISPGRVRLRVGGQHCGFGELEYEIREGKPNRVVIPLSYDSIPVSVDFARKLVNGVDSVIVVDDDGAPVTVFPLIRQSSTVQIVQESEGLVSRDTGEERATSASFGVPRPGEYSLVGRINREFRILGKVRVALDGESIYQPEEYEG